MSQGLFQLNQLIIQLCQSDQEYISDLQIAVQLLDQLYQDQGKDVAKKIDKMIAIFEVFLTEHPSVQLISITNFLDLIVRVINGHPKLAKNQHRCIRLLTNCLNTLAKVAQNIPQFWLNPPNGYSEQFNQNQSEDQKVQLKILITFSILTETIGQKSAAALFEPTFKQYLSITNDWRYPYSALLLSSQINDRSLKMQTINFYVESAIMHLESPCPKVRYACLHLIGVFSSMRPIFQQAYYQKIIPPMVQLLQDSVPRVVAKNFDSLSKFFKQTNQYWQIKNCIYQIIPFFNIYLKKSNTHIMQNSLVTLSTFAQSKNVFGTNLTEILDLVIQVVHSYAGISEYTEVINRCFDFLGQVANNQDENVVLKYLPNLITLIEKYGKYINQKENLTFWSRLCNKYHKFIDIHTIFIQFIQTASHLLSQQEFQYGQNVIQLLSNICLSYKVKIKPYLPRLLIFARQLLEDQKRQNVLRKKSIELMITAIIVTKPSALQHYQQWKQCVICEINYIFGSIERVTQQEYLQLSYLYQALKNLIKGSVEFFNQNQIQQFVIKLQTILAQIQQTYKALLFHKNGYVINQDKSDEDEDEDDESNESEALLIEQNLKALSQCLFNIPLIFKALLGSNCTSIKQWLIEFIIQLSAIHITKQNEWRLLGINFSVILVQSYQYSQLQGIWGDIMNIFISHSSNPHPRIRNSAVYGLGLMFLKTPIQKAQQENINYWLQCLWNAFSLPYQENIQTQYNRKHSRDNIVSTLGKLIYRYSDRFPLLLAKPLYKSWFSQLPLNTDKLEGDIQQHYLNEILIKNPGMILGDGQDLKSILIEYSSFLNKRNSHKNKEILQQTKETLKVITGWPIFKQLEGFLLSNLTKSQINILTHYLGN